MNEQLNITHIEIEELFGIYNYSIPNPQSDISKLLILYGDNGAGKTTIIKILFYLLSSHDNRGHKSELANIAFKKFSVTLSNGQTIIAERDNANEHSYRFIIDLPDADSIRIQCDAELSDGRYVIRSQEMTIVFDHFREMNLALHFLSDDRKIENTFSLLRDDDSNQVNLTNIPRHILRRMEYGQSINETFSLSEAMLELAIKDTEEWFKRQAYIANSLGQDSLNSIYFDVVEKLLEDKHTNTVSDSIKKSRTEISATLKRLQERNQEFMSYKLTKDFNLDRYIAVINKASDNGINEIKTIISPYIEGIEQKLNALENTKNIINVFISTLNQFYTGKKIIYDLENGLKIESLYVKEKTLLPSMLSSGEKQLLLLFCNTITARERASIFIIDEPELSLNVKWQKQLIKSLLFCSEGSSIQFILASHSIELLTQYKNNVTKLENKKI